MIEGIVESVESKQRPADRFTANEGYLALAFVALMFTAPTERLPQPFGMIFGVAIWGAAWLFAISAARRGRAGAQIAGWISLAVLFCHAMLLLLLAYH